MQNYYKISEKTAYVYSNTKLEIPMFLVQIQSEGYKNIELA